ncbi:hypothetical protein GCM10027271_01900 [Saccharopolyspora gloriosae]|uniref:Flagellar motor protein MotB n=1 Tax=Saccharopolyspora gloriosae TaxID=455344 RepID=A0A840NK74_9PSEU|nr:flagellar motor protein MotB [Saccharopolyspora gloriosae]
MVTATETDVRDRESRLAHANRLARAGRYAGARHVLAELGGRDATDPDVLDLLARICAQQGEFSEADECWSRAQEFGDGSPAARDGRRRIAEIRDRGRSGAGRPVLWAAVVACLAASVTGGALVVRDDRADAEVLAGLSRAEDAQRDLQDRFADLRTELAGTVPGRQRSLDELQAELSGTSLVLERDGDVLTAVFPIGLFSRTVVLSAEGEAALGELAGHLRRFGSEVDLTVVGHVDGVRVSDDGRYDGNIELGLSRAKVAAEALVAGSGIPPSGVALTSAGAARPPHPGTTAEGRDRNRTVTLRISPSRR